MYTEQENVNFPYFIRFTFWNLNYVTDNTLLFTTVVPHGDNVYNS